MTKKNVTIEFKSEKPKDNHHETRWIQQSELKISQTNPKKNIQKILNRFTKCYGFLCTLGHEWVK